MATLVKFFFGLSVLIALATAIPSKSAGKNNLCYDALGGAYAGPVPNPNNCGSFYHCQEQSAGNPFPVLTVCPANLLFSFERCVCDYPEFALCYDEDDDDHVAGFFNCANPLK